MGNKLYHLMAIVAVVIWGTTFASTKSLLTAGLTPADILFYRFLLAYIVMWAVNPRFIFGRNFRDELMFIGMGICGGSLYFLTENGAMQYTLTSNVALIVGTAPILTVLLSWIILKVRDSKRSLLPGSLMALLGLGLVVYNGHFILKINPVGDMLALSSALLWAFYTVILKKLDDKYSIYVITRKVFFYGTLTILPVFAFTPLTFSADMMLQPKVIANILFLGLVASLFCFVIWNKAVKQLGSIVSTNYIYFMPVVALLTAAVILHEQITYMAVIGAGLILAGVWIADRGFVIKKSNLK